MDEQELLKPVLIDSIRNRQIAYAVDHTNTLESTMKEVLESYISVPEDKTEFVKNVLLHSSILNLGAKFKLLHHIVEQEGWPKTDRNHFHTLLSVRNAFAHSDTVVQPRLKIDVSKDSLPCGEVTTPDSELVTVNSSGKYETLDRGEALIKFTQSYVALLIYLQDLLRNHIKKS